MVEKLHRNLPPCCTKEVPAESACSVCTEIGLYRRRPSPCLKVVMSKVVWSYPISIRHRKSTPRSLFATLASLSVIRWHCLHTSPCCVSLHITRSNNYTQLLGHYRLKQRKHSFKLKQYITPTRPLQFVATRSHAKCPVSIECCSMPHHWIKASCHIMPMLCQLYCLPDWQRVTFTLDCLVHQWLSSHTHTHWHTWPSG